MPRQLHDPDRLDPSFGSMHYPHYNGASTDRLVASRDSIVNHQPSHYEMTEHGGKQGPRCHSGASSSSVNDPFSDVNALLDPNLVFPKDDAKALLAYHEANRLKQLSRYPRFHYTNLPYFTIFATIVQLAVFIAELAKMGALTGSPFMTKPYFNPMLGPSPSLLINMGARYGPCMHKVPGLYNDTLILFPCANSSTADTNVCLLAELCGLTPIATVVVDGQQEFDPDQWYRVFTPIFMHAGFLHIAFNLLLQCTMGAAVERSIGIIKYALIYLLLGTAGFLLGANFAPSGIASTGCSGLLFGIIATNLLAFLYCGRKNANMYGTTHYKLFIGIMVLEIVVCFVLGLLPGLDNFSHIGGCAIGLCASIVLLPDPFFVYYHGIIAYTGTNLKMRQLAASWNPWNNWDHKIHWRAYCWMAARTAALGLMIAYFVALSASLTRLVDGAKGCTWCKYINCIPVKGWCDIGDLSILLDSSSDLAFPSSSNIMSFVPSTILLVVPPRTQTNIGVTESLLPRDAQSTFLVTAQYVTALL